jgi:cell division septation protein DedD
MQDEGFHEIQLNGKQLVFLFMAGTVVAVVIFLCGVMVGRGVPDRALVAAAGEQTPIDPTAPISSPPSTAVASSGTQPLTAGETLTYHSLLEDPDPPAETLAPAAEPAVASAPAAREPRPQPVAPPAPTPATVTAPAPKPAPVTPPAAQAAAVAATSLSEPGGTGFVVQVAAVRQRVEAERIAQRLSGKGYPAFVTTSGANFRVRVGKFSDRREAETIAGRLEREEQFKPWITR